MSGFSIFNRLGIRERALVLAITPLTLVSLAIGYYLISTRLQDAREAVLNYGRSIAADLATSSGFSLYVGDEQLLDKLISGALLNSDIDSVSICDGRGRVLAHRARAHANGGRCRETEPDLAVFVAPIDSATFARDENPELQGTSVADAPPTVLGRVIVRVTFRQLELRQREIIVKSSAFVLAGIALSALLGVLMANGLLGPLRRVTAVVSRIGRGDLDARLTPSSSGEIGELETGINRTAQTLQDARGQLERRVKLATEALHDTIGTLQVRNVELEAARTQAVKSGNAKAEFMAQISHELRTPLHAIIGFGELLENSVEDAAALEYTRIIGQAGAQLLTVIDDVLAFSSLEAGNFTVVNDVFDPTDILENVVSLFAHEAHRKDLELVLLYLDDAPRSVQGDPARLGQVLMNLLNNAIKFTERGHVVVMADSAPDVTGVPWLRISISDTGIGVAPAFREQMFQPFVQADPSITKRYGGTGLGLAISRMLIQLMDGEIGYRPGDAGGSEFYLKLRGREGVPAARARRPTALMGQPVLVIDAQPFARRALRNAMLHFGARVLQRATLAEADAAIVGAPPPGFAAVAVGLSRAELRLSSTHDVLRSLKQRNIPLLVLAGDELGLPALRANHADQRCHLITKPARQRSLLAALEQLLGGTAQTALKPPARPREGLCQSAFSALIGDDDEFSRKLLRRYLAHWGGSVEEVHDGGDAIERAMARRYDVIFLDIHMSGVDGMAACREIRASAESNRDTPIVAITADVYMEPKAGESFDSIIIKPVTADEIGAALQRLLPRIVLTERPAAHGTEAAPVVDADTVVAALRAQFEALQRAGADGDRGQIKRAAHQLAGVAGFYGHAEWAALIRELEGDAETASVREIEVKVATIGQAIARVSGVDADFS
ncbi:MAG: ATP-binding protein [Thiotrichales bacterium]